MCKAIFATVQPCLLLLYCPQRLSIVPVMAVVGASLWRLYERATPHALKCLSQALDVVLLGRVLTASFHSTYSCPSWYQSTCIGAQGATESIPAAALPFHTA